MGLRWGLLWLLGAAASCLLEGSLGSSPRVGHVSYSSATEACPGLPPFTAEGYIDDQLIIRYESHTRKIHPRVDWLNTLAKEDFRFFNKYMWILQKDEERFQEDVPMLQRRYNQSGDQKAIEEELIYAKEDSISFYIQPIETLNDQKMIVTKPSTIAKVTEMDLKLQLLENYDNFENQLLTIKLDMIKCFIQQTGARSQKQRMGGLY